MPSVGNDIVDLKLARTQSNWQRKGFLEKQYTAEEQLLISHSKNPFQQVWLFWAMKEAAYKCYVQKHKKRFFAPRKISCKIISESKGFVTIENEKYSLSYSISENYIYAIASKNGLIKMDSGPIVITNKKCLNQIINQKVVSNFGANSHIKKDNFGTPRVYQKEKKLPITMSKTHHGKYGAYVFLTDQ